MATHTLAPTAPQTAREWKDNLRERLRDESPILGGQRLFESFLRRPLFPDILSESYEEALESANSRFRLSEVDVQRLAAVFARRHEQLVGELIAALEIAEVEGGLQLVADNTRRQP